MTLSEPSTNLATHVVRHQPHGRGDLDLWQTDPALRTLATVTGAQGDLLAGYGRTFGQAKLRAADTVERLIAGGVDRHIRVDARQIHVVHTRFEIADHVMGCAYAGLGQRGKDKHVRPISPRQLDFTLCAMQHVPVIAAKQQVLPVARPKHVAPGIAARNVVAAARRDGALSTR